MRALKTIVATAVIVFTLTTVAMAGMQRLGGTDEPTRAHDPAPRAGQPAAQAAVTLSAQQFAALLHAVVGDDARVRAPRHVQDRSRTHSSAKSRTHERQHDGDRISGGVTSGTAATTHHAAAHHAESNGSVHTSAGSTHHGSTQPGAHHAGTHYGGGAGCD